jgi:hypothetical protein
MMTTEARNTVTQADTERSSVAVAYPSARHRRGGPASRGPWAPARTGADPVRDNPVIADLLTRAAKGDKRAWDALVERFVPLIWSICRRYRLGDADAEDVSQNVWLYLAGQLDKIRDSGRSSGLAGHHDSAGVPSGSTHGARTAGGQVHARRRGHRR